MVELRSARPGDGEEIRRIDVATWSPRVTPGPRPDGKRDLLERFGAGNVIVAEAGEGLAGYLILGDWTDLDSSRHVLEVKGLAVDPARQGEGIGGALLDAGIERARQQGRRKVTLRVLGGNDGALRLYESRGFVIEGTLRGAFLLEGDYVDDHLMSLDLTARRVRRNVRLAPKSANSPEGGGRRDVLAVGIDVGGRRKGFHGAAVRGSEVVAGPERLADVASAVAWVVDLAPAMVALDSPRTCAPPGATSRTDERELARAVCGIRWTPERSRLADNPYCEWVEHGLELYEALEAAGIAAERLVETFPTAAWTIWAGPRGKVPRSEWSDAALADFDLGGLPYRRLSQDDRDAVAAALVARLHVEGATTAYGEIVTPAALPDGRPAAPPRKARTSPAPPAAARCRPATDRPG
jgi:ribosomal protein S18 acetylase RimI-like enzyme/predicted nuclease with RNAse H fold